MADGLHEFVGDGGQDGKRPGDFARGGGGPFVPYAREAKGSVAVPGVDEVGLGEFFLARSFDEGIGDDDAAPVPDGLAEHGFLKDTHGTGVLGPVFFVVVALGAGVDHIKLLFGPPRGEAKLLHLQGARAIAGDDRSGLSVAYIGVGAPLRRHVGCGLRLEAAFDGLNGRDGNVAATHDAMNLLMTVGKKQGRIAIEGVGASDGPRFHTGGGDDAAVAVLRPNAIEGAVEFEALVRVVE